MAASALAGQHIDWRMCCRVRCCPEALACGVFAAGAHGPVGVCRLAANKDADPCKGGCLTTKWIRALDGLCDGFFRCSPSVDELPRPPPITSDRALTQARDSIPAKFQKTLGSTVQHGTQATTPWRPDSQPLNILWRLVNNSIHIQHTHAFSQLQFSIYPVDTLTDIYGILRVGKLAGSGAVNLR
jgi:hypothetical protein